MGLVNTEITLKNADDLMRVRHGYIKPKEIRQKTVSALVDTGAWTLVINEAIRDELGLENMGRSVATLANGAEDVYELAGPLEVLWKDRRVVCDALVLPGANDILLGAIPLEAMDLIVCPNKQEVVGAHGDQIMHKVY